MNHMIEIDGFIPRQKATHRNTMALTPPKKQISLKICLQCHPKSLLINLKKVINNCVIYCVKKLSYKQ